jgi:uncharacterized protein (DUF1697 family)
LTQADIVELKAICCDAGFARVETYIASGNFMFESEAVPSKVKAELEGRLTGDVSGAELLQ